MTEQEQKQAEALDTYIAMRAIERDAQEHREEAYADYIAAGGTHEEATAAWLSWLYIAFLKQAQGEKQK